MKRIFDFFFSFIGFILFVPVFLTIAIFIKIDTKGPVLFIQKRVGKNFKLFELYKFRSMKENIENHSFSPGNNTRVTRVGKILRKSKLDELPQLWNVLKGDLSLVGPRPEVLEYVNLFKTDYDEILKVTPGITDYAAIEFRNEEEILKNYKDPELGYIQNILPVKIELYKKYLKEKSLLLDIKIIFLTFTRLFR